MWERFVKKPNKLATKKRIYLDYASATPMCDEAIIAMTPFLKEDFGNAGAIHNEGVFSKKSLESARSKVARILGVKDDGVVFTSGGTESINLALIGYLNFLHKNGRDYTDMEIITTKLEHPATLKTVEYLVSLGVSVLYAPVTTSGQIDIKSLVNLLSAKTVLVTVSYVNSEVGTIARCRDIRRVIDEYQVSCGANIVLHVDAAQAPLWLPCDLPRIGADMMSLDGGKFGGGKGCGVLAYRKNISLLPIIYGGGQERGLRPGTEPLPQIIGFSTALELAQLNWSKSSYEVSKIRDYFIARITDEIPKALINGDLGEYRVANNVHISIPGIDAEFAVITLDVHGISCSTKSACSSKGGGASKVVLAMTGEESRALSTLRFTLGPDIDMADIDKTINILKQIVNK